MIVTIVLMLNFEADFNFLLYFLSRTNELLFMVLVTAVCGFGLQEYVLSSKSIVRWSWFMFLNV